eukprot:9511640-Lingulodinium_polyedra.AAC.1
MLRDHLLLHSARLSTYKAVREEVRDILLARQAVAGPAPMDVGELGKGKAKGKTKGVKGKDFEKGKKGKGKQQAYRPDIVCHYCQKKGHIKKDCRKKAADDAKKAEGGAPEPKP